MRRIPRISAWMTAFPWHLDADTPVSEARRFMQEHQIHHVPITGIDQELLGVADLATLPLGSHEVVAGFARMVPILNATMRIDEVLQVMAKGHHPLVLITHQQRLAGIFTWTDVCRLFAEHLRKPFAPSGGGDVA